LAIGRAESDHEEVNGSSERAVSGRLAALEDIAPGILARSLPELSA
jgi:hypothetical protein